MVNTLHFVLFIIFLSLYTTFILTIMCLILYVVNGRKGHNIIYTLLPNHTEIDHDILMRFIDNNVKKGEEFEFTKTLITKNNVIFTEELARVEKFLQQLNPKKQSEYVVLSTILNIVFMYNNRKVIRLFFNDRLGSMIKAKRINIYNRFMGGNFYKDVIKFINQ